MVYVEKAKTEDLQGFNEKENKRKRAYEAKKESEDPQGFKTKVNEYKRKNEAKWKIVLRNAI